jgi:LDH2 family malate/lactate/ureidoglycolate dehydrogenase
MRTIIGLGMAAGVALGIATIDADMGFAVRAIAVGLSPALLTLTCAGLGKLGHKAADLWRRYIEYSREQAEQEYVCLAVRRMRG